MAMLDVPDKAEARTIGGFAPYVLEMCAASAAAADWRARPPDNAQPWFWVSHAQARPPAQGWKLHVSATVTSAGDVLRAALPVLLSDSASFKVADSLSALSDLNEGNGGPSQVGKFITVYPNDDGQAVRLAVALDEATRGLDGPVIVSDRQLHPGSRVSYRYGGFRRLLIQTPVGEVLPALRAPDGELVPDRRLLHYNPPKWAVDPFAAAGVTTPPRAPDLVVGGRYTLFSVLYRSPRGAVYLAIDTETTRRCVLKRARQHGMAGPDGRDARDGLRAEARALTALAPDPRFPAALDLFEHEGDLYLALEDVEGETLEHQIGDRVAEGRPATTAEVVAWGRELAAMLHTVHARGFIYRDLKSSNVIVAPDGGLGGGAPDRKGLGKGNQPLVSTHDGAGQGRPGSPIPESPGGGAPVVGGWGRDNAPNSKERLRLIDFDIADCLADPAPRSGRGTRGYASPQQRAAEAPAVTDDVYSLGALLYFLATGAEASLAPDQFALLNRPPALINPATSPALVQVITRCLDPDPAQRYPSMEAVDAALVQVEAEPPVPAPRFGSEPLSEPSEDAQRRYRALGRRLADTICRAAKAAPDGHGLAWATRHPTSAGGVYTRDLNTGNAGTVLALAELVAAFGDPRHRQVLAEGVRWLAVAPPFEGEPLPGLYIGEAGIGAALLRAGQVLGDAALIDAAVEKGRLVASLPFGSPDLFNGTAGRLRFHLLLWDETREEEHLTAARQAGDSVLAVAEATANGMCWPIPPGYEGLSGGAYLGYAHGAAGIADALLDLYEVTGDPRLRDAARAAADWLMWLAVPVLDDGSGLGWPAIEGHEPSPPLWCHGAAGIGRFFLHADRLGIVGGAMDVAAAAAHATARGARWIGPTQCHGLAGNIELLLDMVQATGDRAYLTEARSLAGLLEGFAAERNGALVFPAEASDLFTPDYMVGYAGVALSLLRLGDPERQPHQLSRRGFRYRPAAEPGA